LVAASIFSIANDNGTGANCCPPALLALLSAALETAICSVGGGMLAQPAISMTIAMVNNDCVHLGWLSFFMMFVLLS
jgi:hypothetical protein